MKKRYIILIVFLIISSGTISVSAIIKSNSKNSAYRYPVLNGKQLIGGHEVKKELIQEGKLPADQPSITLDKALEILSNIEYSEDKSVQYEICSRFNGIAGAPDIRWGSGLDYELYALDSMTDTYLEVGMSGTVLLWTSDDSTEVYTVEKGVVYKK